MKIAILYHQFVRRGGLEGYLREFSARLSEAGHELVIVTSRIDEEIKPPGSDVRIIPHALTSRGTLAKFAERSAAMVPDLKKEVDAVLGFGRTWRQDVHRAGGGCHWHYSKMLPWWKRWKPKNQLELSLEKKLYTGGETRRFVVNSSKVRAELAEAYQVPGDRVSVIHTAVDSTRWRPADPAEGRAELRKKLGIPDDAPALLFVSLDHRRKGLAPLLGALRQVPEARLWVAGQSLDSWQGEIDRAGLTKRVTGLGRTDPLPWCQAADWFVHPTHYDACANTVLQSMASGLPGLISTGDGASEFIREGTNGFLLTEPGNADALADKLKTALAVDAASRLAMGRAARETMLPLTWSAHLEKWMHAINS
ncbi:MAG: glycosyltransferase family 1 protein [Verrucomicrobiales bacterium]|nr:glycosyltransferase family 1 protein [Verrucomicrobiales bacterium]